MGSNASLDIPVIKKPTSDELAEDQTAEKKPIGRLSKNASIDAPDNVAISSEQYGEAVHQGFMMLPFEERHKLAEKLSKEDARDLAADAVRLVLNAPDAPSLRKIQERVGIDPAQLSRIATGTSQGGPQLSSLSKLALALGKRLVIEIK